MDFVLISKEHAHAIREKVRARQGMWDEVAFGLKKSGDAAMENGPWSVTWSDRVAPSGNPHDYFSEGTYFWQNPADPDGPYLHLDGQANPNRFHQHLDEFGWLADTVLDLVHAGYYLEEEKYLDRAAYLLDVWFVNEKTRMNPHMKYSQGVPHQCEGACYGLIELGRADRVAHALGFLSENEKYAATVAGVKRWCSDMIDWILTPGGLGWEELLHGNNHSGWCVAHIMLYAALNDRVDIIRQMADFYKEKILEQIEANGDMPRETARTRGFSYSMFGRHPLVIICEVALKYGIDLWHCENSKGATLQTAFDWFLPYVENPFSWNHQQITDDKVCDMLFLQYAALRLQKPEYTEVNRKRREGYKLIRKQEPMGPLCLLEGFEP